MNDAMAYYGCDNDIRTYQYPGEDSKNPLRRADNRISHGFHRILVDQTASYLFTYPPTFDAGEKAVNKSILSLLGDCWNKVCQTLSVDASNAGAAWLHVWKDQQKQIKYWTVDPRQIIPVYSGALDRALTAVLRIYQDADDNGDGWTIYEYWTDTECFAFRKKSGGAEMESYFCFPTISKDTGEQTLAQVFRHDFGVIPFIEFPNNNSRRSDLKPVKGLIDVYDKVLSGYINDVEDIQQLIFVLQNYGGQDLDGFLGDLKRYKVVDMQGAPDQKSGLDTLSIDIPIEARNALAEIVRRAIFEQGQGVEINPDKLGNVKGVVIDHLYGFLELKAGLKETEFRIGFGKLVRILLKSIGHSETAPISQTWQRNKIKDDLELSQMIANLAPVTSKQNIAKANPLVEDWEEELSLLKAEGVEYRKAFETPDLPGGDGV